MSPHSGSPWRQGWVSHLPWDPLTVVSVLRCFLFFSLPSHGATGNIRTWAGGGQPPTSPRHSSFWISSFSSFLLRVSLLPSLPEYLWKVVTIVAQAFSRGVSMMVCSSGGGREGTGHTFPGKPDLLLPPITSPFPRPIPQGSETGIHETKIHQQVDSDVSRMALVRAKLKWNSQSGETDQLPKETAHRPAQGMLKKGSKGRSMTR